MWWWWWCLMLDRVTSSQADPWSRAQHHKTPVWPLVKRCHNMSRVWRFTSRGERDCVTVSHKPGHSTGILSMKDWLHIAATRHRAGGVFRPFVLVSPFFLWSRWPRARSQVLRMLRIYLAIRELQTNTQLHRYTLHCYRCMHVFFSQFSVLPIWK